MKNKKKLTTKKKATRKQSDETKAYTGIVHTEAYAAFQEYCSLPRALRQSVLGVNTQGEFAKQWKVDEDTLNSWKKREDFWKETFKLRRQFFSERTADVILGVETKAIKTGDAASARLILEVTEEVKREKDDPSKMGEALGQAIAKVFEILK